MLRSVTIRNYKSIPRLKLEMGRVNVLIGENGCGKTNILEAIAFASAAIGDKLDNQFLVRLGIRVTDPRFMRSAFQADSGEQIEIDVEHSSGLDFKSKIVGQSGHDDPTWTAERAENGSGASGAIDRVLNVEELAAKADELAAQQDALMARATELEARFAELHDTGESDPRFREMVQSIEAEMEALRMESLKPDLKRLREMSDFVLSLASYLVYSPEKSALRTFERKGQILPLGIRGEGLFKLLHVLSSDADRWSELGENLALLDWFDGIRIASDSAPGEQMVEIKDRYLNPSLAHLDQRSASEGFLYLLFYFALFISDDTPNLFAIDNIDTSLNPKLCSELLRRLVALSAKFEKQVILTTHNPAVLDGLDLADDQQRLFVVYRNSNGHTSARRVGPPMPVAGETPERSALSNPG